MGTTAATAQTERHQLLRTLRPIRMSVSVGEARVVCGARTHLESRLRSGVEMRLYRSEYFEQIGVF